MGRTKKPVEAEVEVAEEVVETEEVTETAEEVVEEAVEEAAPEVAQHDEVADDAEEEPEIDGDSVTVSWNGGERTYSEEIHGKDFKKLAKGFAIKFGGTIA